MGHIDLHDLSLRPGVPAPIGYQLSLPEVEPPKSGDSHTWRESMMRAFIAIPASTYRWHRSTQITCRPVENDSADTERVAAETSRLTRRNE